MKNFFIALAIVVIFIVVFFVGLANIPNPNEGVTYIVRYVDPIEGNQTVKATNLSFGTGGCIHFTRDDCVNITVKGNYVCEKR